MLRLQQAIIVLMGAALAALVILFLQRNVEDEIERATLHAARSYSETFTAIRNFYQEIVVNRVIDSDVVVTHDYRNFEHSVPIPATMMIELARYLNGSDIDITFALVSDYPFPWRDDRSLLEFDLQALKHLRQTGGSEFYWFDEEAGRTYLHYARPILMEEGCVSCHNSYPTSPKTDWSVGDVRAVQVFEIPIDDVSSENQLSLAWLLGAIIFTMITGVFSLLLLNWRSDQARNLLRKEAHYDTLTETLRRQRFQEIYENNKRNISYYLAIADIDDFKAVNTSLGHAAGDIVLARVAASIRDSFAGAEVVCRYGGEEFLILVPVNLVGPEPTKYFDHAVKCFSKTKISIRDIPIPTTISIGYVDLLPDADIDFRVIQADFALRHAKRLGKNRAVFASKELLRDLGFSFEQYTLFDLEEALKKGEICFVFQPIFDCQNNIVNSFEALVRWRRPDGFAPPPTFLPQYLAALRKSENAKFILSAIREALATTPWPVADLAKISFNIDPYDLFNDLEKNSLITALLELKKQSYCFALEITETPYLSDRSSEEFAERLRAVAALGFCVHMDDFGKEGASIERLAAFNFATIKADRSLIADLLSSQRRQFALKFLLEYAKSNNAAVVVEGVETEEERDFLRSLGVQFMQGFLFGKPK